MIVESLWKNVKHRDLKDFNRPRLDLVTHVVLTSVLPRVKQTLDTVLGVRQIGRPTALAGWQEDFKKDWLEFSQCDELRLIKKELKWRRKPKNTKVCQERLAEIAEEETRPHGNLEFFLKLRCQYYPPYYNIEGIHDVAPDADKNTGLSCDVQILGHIPLAIDDEDPTSLPQVDEEDPTSLPQIDGEIDPEELEQPQDEDPCEDSEEEDGVERCFLSQARRQNIWTCIKHMMEVAESPAGYHPKLGKRLEKVLTGIEEFGGSIRRDKNARVAKRTWQDSDGIMLFVD
ncbi:hypothetical protein H0H93_009804 [Arthromyces matolae]|nr:hypothetical protein H0H93_009804 [Arthromyces matolae]